MLRSRSPQWWVGRLGLAAGLAVFAVYLGLWAALIRGGGTDAADFTAFYTGWTMVLDGQGTSLYDPAVQAVVQRTILEGRSFEAGLLPFSNPPHLVLPFVPLALLPLGTAYLMWGSIQIALVAWLVVRSTTVIAADWSATERALLIGASLAATPLVVSLLQGAFSVLLSVAVLEAFISLRAGQERRAAFWLLAGALKPQALVAPIVAVVSARRWRLVAWFAGLSLGLGLVTTAVFGVAIWSSYLSFLSGYLGSFDVLSVRPSVMWNLRGTLALWVGPVVDAAEAATINVIALAAQLGGVLAVAALWWRTWDPSSSAFAMRFSVTIALGLLLSPHLNPHDAVVLIPAGAIAYGAIRDRSWGPRVGVVLFAAPFFILLTNPISANDIATGPIRTPVALMALGIVGGLLAMRTLRLPRGGEPDLSGQSAVRSPVVERW